MNKLTPCGYIAGSLVLLCGTLPSLAIDGPTRNSGIDPEDTYVSFDENVTTVVTLRRPIAQNTSPAKITSKRSRMFHIEEGYDTSGNLVLNLSRDDSSPSLGHTIAQARLTGGKVEFFDANGIPSHTPTIDTAQLGSTLSVVSNAPLIKHSPIQDIQAYAKAASANILNVLPSSGTQPATVTLQMPARGRSNGTFTKTFKQLDQGWILTQTAINGQITDGSAGVTISYSNVLWHQNAAKDAARKSEQHGRPALPLHIYAGPPASIETESRNAPASSCPTTITQLGTAQNQNNIVFQHGLKGSSCSWNDPTFSMTKALNNTFSFGKEIVPSLTSTDPLASQTSSLVSLLQSNGGSNYVLIGHSQGGLISRSAAHYFQTNSPGTVKGVITVDTPNLGAPLIINGVNAIAQKLGGYLNGILNAITQTFYCEDDNGNLILCNVGDQDPNGGAILYGLLSQDGVLNDAVAAAGIYVLNSAVPATIDLEPGSQFLNQLNSYSENFVRVGIVSDSYDNYWDGFSSIPFLPEHMGADLGGGANLGQSTVEGFQAADLALNAITAFLQLDEESNDCIDYPDQPVCHNDDQYFNAYSNIDNWIYVPDAFWDPLPLPNECCDFSDGIVNGQSQYYPPQKNVVQYYIPNADTHFASTKSTYVASALYTALESNFNVPINGCTYSLSSSGAIERSSGGQGTITITTGSTCPWSISSNVSWITFTPSSGTGSATVTYTVAADTSADRTGTLVIAGQTIFTVKQQSVGDWWEAVQYLLTGN